MRKAVYLILVLVIAGMLWMLQDEGGGGSSQTGAQADGSERGEEAVAAPLPAGESRSTEEAASAAEPASRTTLRAAAPEEPALPDPDPDWATLEVLVRDRKTGRPVPDVEVTLAPRDDDPEVRLTFLRWMEEQGWGEVKGSEEHPYVRVKPDAAPRTDESGAAALPVLPGFALTVRVNGRADVAGNAWEQTEALAPQERRTLTLKIAVGMDLAYFGRVVRKEDGVPVAGAAIRAAKGNMVMEEGLSMAPALAVRNQTLFLEMGVTDASGVFRADGHSWQSPFVWIQAEGYSPVLAAIKEDHDSRQTAETIPIHAAASMTGQVTAPDGVPRGSIALSCRGYAIRSEGERVHAPSDPTWRSTLNENGSFTIHDLPAGVPLKVRFERTNGTQVLHNEDFVFEPGETRHLIWDLGGLGSVHGIVVDQDGLAVADVPVVAMRSPDEESPDGSRSFMREDKRTKAAETRTDAEGRFDLPAMQPGRWLVGVLGKWNQDVGVSPVGVVVTVPEGQREAVVRLEVHRGLYIRGRLVGPDGATGEQGFLYAWSQEIPGSLNTQSKHDGTFELGPLVPGSYQLHASSNEGTSIFPSVLAEAGEEDLILRAVSGGLLRGRVFHADGTPAARVQIRVAPHGSWELTAQWADEDGRYTLDGLSAGVTDLLFEAKNGEAHFMGGVRVDPGTERELPDVRLLPGAKVRLKMEDGESNGMAWLVQGEASMWLDVVGDGVNEATVPAGRWRLETRPWDSSAVTFIQDLDLQPGETREVVLEPPAPPEQPEEAIGED